MFFLLLSACTDLEACIMETMPLSYDAPELVVESKEIQLHKVLEGFPQVTDIQFFPKETNLVLIAQKEGQLSLMNLSDSHISKRLIEIPVRTAVELGLLGVAIPPDFKENGSIYLHFNPKEGERRTEVSEWTLDIEKGTLEKKRILFELKQPYPNHNGGQLLFGEDGHLYLGLGDGGWRNDPLESGQDKKTALGTILRFQVDKDDLIPADNPFIKEEGANPYIWVYGLRNPWRFSFLPDGNLIIADVGQDKYEEVSIAKKGDNLGWKTKEAMHCFEAESCDATGLVEPIFEYDHSLGASITGGYVVQDGSVFDGQYIFGDFTTGRIWALDWQKTEPAQEILMSGLNISTFGRNAAGQVFVGDFGKGVIYRLGF